MIGHHINNGEMFCHKYLCRSTVPTCQWHGRFFLSLLKSASSQIEMRKWKGKRKQKNKRQQKKFCTAAPFHDVAQSLVTGSLAQSVWVNENQTVTTNSTLCKTIYGMSSNLQPPSPYVHTLNSFASDKSLLMTTQ